MTEAEIEALERPDTWNEVFDDRKRALLHLADAMSGDTSTLDAGLITALRDHFTEAELAELILVAGQANLNNRVGNVAKQLLGERSDG
ncbi:MAG: hypothetical protein EX269_09470 [Acidimicrobiales bacterium]|nr:MAG: hypothetical protein EX269_09470 [Acidimicrobiales bacterium]